MRRRVNIRAQPSALTRSIRLRQMNARKCSLTQYARERVARWLERSGRNAEPRVGKEQEIVASERALRWEMHNTEGEDGRCAL